MDCLDRLIDEHDDHKRLLDAFEAFAGHLDAPAAHRDLARFVEVLRATLHGAHHDLEEGALFATLMERGYPAEAGPVAVLRGEHAESTARLRVLAAASAAPPPAGAARGRLAAEIRAYVAGLRRHIAREEEVVFPAARAYLTDAALQAIERLLDEQPSVPAALLGARQELVDRYAPGPHDAGPAPGGGTT